jgi:hypothetical protein
VVRGDEGAGVAGADGVAEADSTGLGWWNGSRSGMCPVAPAATATPLPSSAAQAIAKVTVRPRRPGRR